MRTVVVRVTALAFLLSALALTGSFTASSETGIQREELSQTAGGKKRGAERPAAALNYRSPGTTHKLMIPKGEADLESRFLTPGAGAVRTARDYPAFTLVEVTDEALLSLDSGSLERARIRDDLNLILLRSGQIDTTGPEPNISPELRQPDSQSESLHLVQLFGPPTNEVVRSIRRTGARIVSYVPNNAYLIWADRQQISRIRQLRQGSPDVQWEGPFHPLYKIDPRLKSDSSGQARVTIRVVDTPHAADTVAGIKARALEVISDEFVVSGTLRLQLLVDSSELAGIARLPDVLSIERASIMELHDERANQIIAGAFEQELIGSRTVGRPSSPGYLTLLGSLGFTSNFDLVVDVADSGLDVGSFLASQIHPDFLDAAGASRVRYLHDFTDDAAAFTRPAHDALGHGTINASIMGGYSNRVDFPFADSLGFRNGLGVAPFVKFGVSKVFNNRGSFLPNRTSLQEVVAAAYRNEARITTNSWGTNCNFSFCNFYTDESALYDWFVRDADPFTEGNQQMVVVFSSGNAGAMQVSAPATAKNVITVGASENFRPTDDNGVNRTDGCGVPSTLADNALDVVSFSSGGPLSDGRVKPDLVAPGTHVMGAASQDPLYSGLGICDSFFPSGQTLYSWSSGTSHSTPMVAGAAALAYQWLHGRTGLEPSPALVKALILNSTTYLTGTLAGDDLPGSRQGWGLLNISRMFEETDRIIHDESPERTFTDSGGDAFQLTGVVSDPSKEFRVMLVWTDPPGNPIVNAPHVNQLNLEVLIGGTRYLANNFSGEYSVPGGQDDFLNNVQGVRLPAGTTGPFVIRVHPRVIAGDGVPGNEFDLDQDFALVVTNAIEMDVPLLALRRVEGVTEGVTVAHQGQPAGPSVLPGRLARITVPLRNESPAMAAGITSATLVLDGVGSSIGSYPEVPPEGIEVNSTPFDIQIPSNLSCGTILQLRLELDTPFGEIALPVSIRIGRQSSQVVLLDDDVDGGRVKWVLRDGFRVSSQFAHRGTRSYHAVDPDRPDDFNVQRSMLRLKKNLKIPSNAGEIRLSFFHIYDFEPGFDGGVLEVSSDKGETWQDLGSRIIVGGYDGQVTEDSDNPLGNRFAWTARGRTGVFSQVVVNLDDFRGKKIRVRFLAGFDEATGLREGYTGWFIDDIRITTKRFDCSGSVGQAESDQVLIGPPRPVVPEQSDQSTPSLVRRRW